MDYYTNIVRRGDRLLIRGVRNGEEVRDKVRYEPTLYIEHHKEYGYKSLYGKNLKPIEFSNMLSIKILILKCMVSLVLSLNTL